MRPNLDSKRKLKTSKDINTAQVRPDQRRSRLSKDGGAAANVSLKAFLLVTETGGG